MKTDKKVRKVNIMKMIPLIVVFILVSSCVIAECLEGGFWSGYNLLCTKEDISQAKWISNNQVLIGSKTYQASIDSDSRLLVVIPGQGTENVVINNGINPIAPYVTVDPKGDGVGRDSYQANLDLKTRPPAPQPAPPAPVPSPPAPAAPALDTQAPPAPRPGTPQQTQPPPAAAAAQSAALEAAKNRLDEAIKKGQTAAEIAELQKQITALTKQLADQKTVQDKPTGVAGGEKKPEAKKTGVSIPETTATADAKTVIENIPYKLTPTKSKISSDYYYAYFTKNSDDTYTMKTYKNGKLLSTDESVTLEKISLSLAGKADDSRLSLLTTKTAVQRGEVWDHYDPSCKDCVFTANEKITDFNKIKYEDGGATRLYANPISGGEKRYIMYDDGTIRTQWKVNNDWIESGVVPISGTAAAALAAKPAEITGTAYKLNPEAVPGSDPEIPYFVGNQNGKYYLYRYSQDGKEEPIQILTKDGPTAKSLTQQQISDVLQKEYITPITGKVILIEKKGSFIYYYKDGEQPAIKLETFTKIEGTPWRIIKEKDENIYVFSTGGNGEDLRIQIKNPKVFQVYTSDDGGINYALTKTKDGNAEIWADKEGKPKRIVINNNEQAALSPELYDKFKSSGINKVDKTESGIKIILKDGSWVEVINTDKATSTSDWKELTYKKKVIDKEITTQQILKDSLGTTTTKTAFSVNIAGEQIPGEVKIVLDDKSEISIKGADYAQYVKKITDDTKKATLNTEIGMLYQYARIKNPTDIGEYKEGFYKIGTDGYVAVNYDSTNKDYQSIKFTKTKDGKITDLRIKNTKKSGYNEETIQEFEGEVKSVSPDWKIEGTAKLLLYDKEYWPLEVDGAKVTYISCGKVQCGPGSRQEAEKVSISINGADCGEGGKSCTGEQKIKYDNAMSAVYKSRIGPALSAAYSGAVGGTALSTLFGCKAGEQSFCGEWRERMDNFFAVNVLGQLISGKWEESACHRYIERETQGVAVIPMQDTMTMVGIGAHIEAERSEPVTYPNGTQEFLYKITFAVKNPQTIRQDEKRTIKFNVELHGEKTVWLFGDYLDVEPSQKTARSGKDAIVQYSNYRYDEICLIFQDSIKTAAGEFIDRLCNNVNQYTGGAVGYTPAQTSGQSASSSGNAGVNQI